MSECEKEYSLHAKSPYIENIVDYVSVPRREHWLRDSILYYSSKSPPILNKKDEFGKTGMRQCTLPKDIAKSSSEILRLEAVAAQIRKP